MSWPNYTKSKSRKHDLYYIAITVMLCFTFYFIGSGGGNNTTTDVTAVIPHQSPCLGKSHSPSINSSSETFQLDFTAHHTADHLYVHAPPDVARDHHAPSCSAAMSEYTPCEDAGRSLKFDRERLVYRERHCPEREEDALMCRVPAPYGYKVPVRWPESRDSVWYANVPHKELTVEKAGQNWVKFEGERFRFPGGGTMFPKGADAYIDEIGALINLRDGSIRTAIDTGCGVASWGSYLLSRNILPISFAPRDTHEAQVQFALERGVPALIGILASKRLPYPSRAFDMAHCSRCLIPWGQYDGLYLIEVDRILRPGGYWILSGPPINWESRWKGWERTEADLDSEQNTIESIARSLCWKKLTQKGDLAIWQKPSNHIHCRMNRKIFKQPRFCQDQNPDNAWYTKMEACLTPLPDVSNIKETAGGELEKWPERLTAVPPRIKRGTLKGITDEMFQENTKLWRLRVAHYKSFDYHLAEKGRYRNLLDMGANLGGFAASLVDDPVWVMNVVPVEAEIDTLGVIYERGLIGTYQNWCEAMSTYPRTYDFIHADSVFSLYKDRCDIGRILLEMDRILRPEGSIIIRDDVDVVVKIRSILDGMQYESRVVDHEKGPHEREKILYSVKQYWTAPEPDQNQESSEERQPYNIPPGDQIN